ncbi:hypothetical protein GCM10023350_36610 [Nocardioides endophyticus]|uniref:HTH marR-type domain-containing protein n=1 Tax=Nocardioides endophyticus TaxID=1353775 RepID=A0ABP8Z6Y2_9ACTN
MEDVRAVVEARGRAVEGSASGAPTHSLDLVRHGGGFALTAADHVASALWRHTVGDDLTQPQFLALTTLRAHPGIGNHELADRAAVDRATAAPLLRKLTERGLVSRHKDPRDSRRAVLTTTDRADRLLLTVTEQADAVDRALMAPLIATETAAVVQSWSALGRSELDRDEPPHGDSPDSSALLPLAARPWFHLRRARRTHRRLWREHASVDVRASQFALLAAIADSPGVDIRHAAAAAMVEDTTAVRIVMRLARTRLVHDRRDPEDRRRTLLQLTDAGHTLHQELSERVPQIEHALARRLPPQAIAEFTRLTRAVARIDGAIS